MGEGGPGDVAQAVEHLLCKHEIKFKAQSLSLSLSLSHTHTHTHTHTQTHSTHIITLGNSTKGKIVLIVSSVNHKVPVMIIKPYYCNTHCR
jgi:hypothetical protein